MRLPIAVSRTLAGIALFSILIWLAPPTRADIIPLFNTGVDDNGQVLDDAAIDPHYLLIVSADASYPGPDALTINNANYPLGDSPDWLPNDNDSRWIGPRADPSRSEGNSGGEYVYRTTFEILGIDPGLVRIAGRWVADDRGTILLNGIATGITTDGGLQAFHAFSIAEGFRAGTNTLDFVVTNFGGPTGLRVELSARVVPEPSSIALIGLGGIGLVIASRRRRLASDRCSPRPSLGSRASTANRMNSSGS